MVNVLISTDSRYPVNRKQIRKAVVDTFTKHEISDSTAEVSVAVVGERKMKKLTEIYLGDGKKHEILTFPFEEVSTHRDKAMPAGRQGFVYPPDGVLRLGDIILCWPYVLEAAAADDIMVDDEVYSLTVHGAEHLLGTN